MTKEEIFEAITDEDFLNRKEYGGVTYYPRTFSPERLAAFLAKHLPNKDT